MAIDPNPEAPRLRKKRAGLALVAVAAVVVAVWLRAGRGDAPNEPVTEPVDVAARFTSIAGNVKLRAVGGLEWSSASMNTPLRRNDLLRTYPQSSAEIRFLDDTRVVVRPDSLITIEETSRDPAANSTAVSWKINEGEINYETSQRGAGSTEAVTPTFRLALDGAAAGTVRVGADKRATIAQRSGSATVETTTGEKTRLSANEGVVVDASGRLGAKQTLPTLPPVTPPGDGSGVVSLAEGAPVPLSWPVASGAASYRVVVEETRTAGAVVILDRKGVTENRISVPGLGSGDFSFRVAPETAAGIEGAFSPRVPFRVQRKAAAAAPSAPPPSLRIDAIEVRGNVVRLAGRTDPDARLTVNGQPVPVQPDGSFREFVTLALKAGEDQIVIRAVNSAGGVTEETRTAGLPR
jgi:hypothetical protein